MESDIQHDQDQDTGQRTNINTCDKVPIGMESDIQHDQDQDSGQRTNINTCDKVPIGMESDIQHDKDSGQRTNINTCDKVPIGMESDIQHDKDSGQRTNINTCDKVPIGMESDIQHHQDQDSSQRTNINTCDTCGKTFGATRSLVRHRREQHQLGITESRSFTTTCFICEKQVPKGRLNEHFKFHGVKKAVTKSTEKSTIPCGQCPTKFSSLKNLRAHVQRHHGVVQEVENHHFDNEADFLNWLRSIEKEGSVSFVAMRGVSKVAGGTKKIFYCNRSGHYVPKGKNIKRIKSQGTCKLDTYCSASVETVYLESGVNVTYNKTHYGHSLNLSDLIHVRINKQDKDGIAGKLRQGMPIQRILDETRGTAGSDRTALVKRRDVLNIMRDYGVKSIGVNPHGVNSAVEDNEAKLEGMKQRLHEELLEIVTKVHGCTSAAAVDAARQAAKKLKMSLSVPSNGESFGDHDRREPVNKKAPKQARFFSAKRKRCTKDESKALTKPSKQARLSYGQALLNGPESSDDYFVIPSINFSDANIDHMYQ